ncbi:SUMO-specific isopeptidase USPL1 isoform X1 [Marmota flaviventris]|uniref:SUMO-specific isopeptidase USPL1 isoform X1 n=2 Tax=Marmota flaviventris TaxID=93162 RepID=UPI003A8A7CA8
MMDSPKIGNGLPVIGPGADIGVSSLPMVGYLGKNYNSAKATSDGYCPACREKGKVKALKTYRISFQESISLCEDLQCIYPLGSKSLNLISPDLEDCHIPNKPQKRKILETSCNDSPFLANSKKTRNHLVTDREQVLNSKYDEILSNLPNSSSQQNSVRTAHSLDHNETLDADNVDMAEEDPITVDVSETGGISPQNEGYTSELEMPLEIKCSSFLQTLCVQWKNTNALCWLDCLLSALVHLEELKNTVTKLCSKEESVFWRLFEKYDQASKLLYNNHLDGVKDGKYKITSKIFTEIETCLNEVRGEIFTELQPQLRCTLGDMESPVFAFPLLLKIEPHIEKLFTYSFSWDFECSQCGHRYQNRCMKSLVTFTNVISEWHPLNAAHFGPCNACNSKSQIRKMVLEKVSPIFMLHFVEGLPQNDMEHYAFHFEGCLYQATSVIQYQTKNHFITWILDADGSWLECDDLKGPCAERHEKFEVPASEIHIVIWERKSSYVTDKEATHLRLPKTNDKHTFGEKKPASPAWCSVGEAASAETSSATRPTHVSSVVSHAVPQDKAIAHEDRDEKTLIDDIILPLTLKGTIQKTAPDFPINSKVLPSKNKSVTENIGLGKANTLPSQESLTASSASSPRKEKLTQAQFVDLSFPSQVVNVNTQSVQPNSGDTSITTSMNSIHSTSHVQGMKSVEIEKETELKQFLPPKIEKIKPEQLATSQVSNLKKNTVADSQTVIAKSSQNQPPKENQKKPFVGSWVKGLLSRGASFMPPCVSAHNRNTVTDLQPSVKGANNFGGFKTKGLNQKANRLSKKARKSADKSPPVCSPLPGPLPSGTTAVHPHTGGNSTSELLKKCESASQGVHLSHDSHRNENGVSSANHGDSVEGQIHKLRLKLLKKLKAKKRKLAALTSSLQSETLPSENLEPVPHCGSPNDCESIEDLLNELQYQIDIADNKSGCTTIPVSSYSGQTHEEILAELLSPTTISTELSENGETDFRYLEMGDNPFPVPSELNDVPQNTHLKQDHNYCSPTKGNQCEVHPDSLTNNASLRTSNLESPMKTDIFDEFFSTSALNSLANDTLDLPHFDEYLFEN